MLAGDGMKAELTFLFWWVWHLVWERGSIKVRVRYSSGHVPTSWALHYPRRWTSHSLIMTHPLVMTVSPFPDGPWFKI